MDHIARNCLVMRSAYFGVERTADHVSQQFVQGGTFGHLVVRRRLHITPRQVHAGYPLFVVTGGFRVAKAIAHDIVAIAES